MESGLTDEDRDGRRSIIGEFAEVWRYAGPGESVRVYADSAAVVNLFLTTFRARFIRESERGSLFAIRFLPMQIPPGLGH